ncbi:MAG: cysteine desulfurase [Alphaproteobacteria bacterium]|nr:cysteine desulfurase [Alphaproteobacteria bacterium]
MSEWRADFPALQGTMNGKPLAFLDSAASAQKPQVVLDKVMATLSGHYANIHRGLYEYSQRTTAEFEAVRGKVANFLNAKSENEIVFTRNSTEAINLVAHAWGQHYLHADDEVILTEMEHHANIVPWHLLRDLTGIVIKYIPVTQTGELDLSKLEGLLTKKTRLVSFVHVSNALGTINDAASIVAQVRAYNPDIKILVDGSQSAVHMPTDVQKLGCDWFVCTGHKLYGPTGVGVLWGRGEILAKTPPYQGGGDMIERVALHGIKYREPPQRFEAGTPPIVEVIGLGAAIDYMQGLGWDKITAHENALSRQLYGRLSARKDLRIIGTSPNRAGIVSFLMDGASSADVGMILDQCGVAVRTGHHCCQPLLGIFGVEGTIRASLALYSTEADIDALETGLDKARKLLA